MDKLVGELLETKNNWTNAETEEKLRSKIKLEPLEILIVKK